MSIIQGIRTYLQSCPFLDQWTGSVQVDYTADRGASCGIAPTGEQVLARYCDGTVRKRYGFSLFARAFTEADVERLENCEFLERFSRWIEDNDRAGIYPILPDGMEAEQIDCANGMLFDCDPDGGSGLYQVQLSLIYEKKE